MSASGPSRPRIVLTGVGATSAFGVGLEALAKGLWRGERAIGEVTLFDVSDQRTRLAAEVPERDLGGALPASVRSNASRTDALAFLAAEEAVRHARLDLHRARAALVLGGTVGGMSDSERFFAKGRAEGVEANPRLLEHPLSAAADLVARALGLRGPRAVLCTACASSATSLAHAAELLARGECDVALAGGADALCRMTFTGFNALGAISPEPCRPFDARRSGLTLGEGSAIMVLERLEDARARGATVLAELRGYGAATEAHHITLPQPDGRGAARAMRDALESAGLDASFVDYVNAHGTATPANDPMESAALHAALGARATEVPVSSTKSLFGHTLGAAGALEAAVCVLAMRDGMLPATAGLEEVDPRCELAHVRGAARPARPRVCLSNSFGFGGADAALCLADLYASLPPLPASRERALVLRAGASVHGERSLERLAEGLDGAKVRRVNRLGLAAIGVATEALALASTSEVSPERVGAVVGTAWGSLDETAAFVRRSIERGARLAPPAEFPNLVLSAPAGHLSIYHRVEGPVLTVAALEVSGEVAVCLAAEELLAGRADVMLAASAEEHNPEIVGLIDTLQTPQSLPRAEGAACVRVEAEALVPAGAGALLAMRLQRGWPPAEGREAQQALREAVLEALERFSAQGTIDALYTTLPAETLQGLLGEGVKVLRPDASLGRSEALGVVNLVAAVTAVSAGVHRRALVLSAAPGALVALGLEARSL